MGTERILRSATAAHPLNPRLNRFVFHPSFHHLPERRVVHNQAQRTPHKPEINTVNEAFLCTRTLKFHHWETHRVSPGAASASALHLTSFKVSRLSPHLPGLPGSLAVPLLDCSRLSSAGTRLLRSQHRQTLHLRLRDRDATDTV